MPERSQVLHESLLNFKVEGSWSKMASIGKAGSIEMALQGHGNICGSGSNNGISCEKYQKPHVFGSKVVYNIYKDLLRVLHY